MASSQILPGRVGSNEIFSAQFGESTIYFYMTQEKQQLAKQMIQDVNEEMQLTLGQAALPCPTVEILVQAIKHPERDPKGSQILDRYANQIQAILENVLNIHLSGVSRYINLNLNWEALKVHQDRFKEQYSYLQSIQQPNAAVQYTLLQDLTQIDWQMSQGTIAATMIQDGRMGDRFLLAIFPTEVVGTLYAEPAAYVFDNQFEYPGNVTMPPHSVIAPMDFDGNYTPGSSKGKRMSTVVRGVILTKEMNQIYEKSKKLSVNRRQLEIIHGIPCWNYDNGIVVKTTPEKMPPLSVSWNLKYADKENVSIIKVPTENNLFLIQQIAQLFNISVPDIKKVDIKRLTKKDGGFSHFNLMDLEIPPSSQLVILNSSEFPPGYRHFIVAEDCTKKGLPWIQLYHFDPSTAINVPPNVFKELSMSPVEELIHRNENVDGYLSEHSVLMKKLVSQLDIFIFPQTE